MEDRFNLNGQVQNGGMFSREKIQQIAKQVVSLYGNQSRIQPPGVARCMIDTYRGMNKHFIPTGYQLSLFARVFDRDRKGVITQQDIISTASRMFLANTPSDQSRTAFR